jgi:hypothetical protein
MRRFNARANEQRREIKGVLYVNLFNPSHITETPGCSLLY